MNYLLFLVNFIIVVQGTALTVLLGPQETSCYYVYTEKPDSTIGFYFAVQSGGLFDINFQVKDPLKKPLINGVKERQGDWSFKGELVGEYEFCFNNEISKFDEKILDFEINLENDNFQAKLPKIDKNIDIDNTNDEPVDKMIYSIDNIDNKLNNMLRTLQYYKTRNNRNQNTVKSTNDRIFWFSFLEIGLMSLLAFFQISVVHYFFKGSRRQMV